MHNVYIYIHVVEWAFLDAQHAIPIRTEKQEVYKDFLPFVSEKN